MKNKVDQIYESENPPYSEQEDITVDDMLTYSKVILNFKLILKMRKGYNSWKFVKIECGSIEESSKIISECFEVYGRGSGGTFRTTRANRDSHEDITYLYEEPRIT